MERKKDSLQVRAFAAPALCVNNALTVIRGCRRQQTDENVFLLRGLEL